MAVYLDFTRAFETINHKLLLKKLENKGFCNKSLLLLENYLSNRIQRTSINSTISEPYISTIGVPQGTIIGPWLFILFLNDIFKICSLANCVCFADDLLLLYDIDKNCKECPTDITNSLNLFGDWIDSNLLLINLEKSAFMIYSLNNNKNRNGNFQVQLASKRINHIHSTKYLGLTFESDLSFKLQVDILTNRLKFYCKYAFYLSKVLNKHTKLLWYNAYVTSLLVSNCIILRTIGKNLIAKIQSYHLKIIRILFRSELNYYDPVNNIKASLIGNNNFKLTVSNEIISKFLERNLLLTYTQTSLYQFIKFIIKQRYFFTNHNLKRFNIGFKLYIEAFNSKKSNLDLSINRNTIV